MQCPECRGPLVIVESDGVELDLCAQGDGTWFDAQELRLLFLAAGADDGLAGLEERLAELPSGPAARRCPRCRRRMQQVSLPDADGPVLDRCPDGDGLWFDRGELRALLHAAGADDDPGLAPVVAYLAEFDGAPQEDPA